jgi:hypothetical protein
VVGTFLLSAADLQLEPLLFPVCRRRIENINGILCGGSGSGRGWGRGVRVEQADKNSKPRAIAMPTALTFIFISIFFLTLIDLLPEIKFNERYATRSNVSHNAS